MKRFYILIYLLFISIAARSQNWQAVSSNRSAFFKTPGAQSLRAVSIDSSYFTGTDTILYSYRSVDDQHYPSIMCFHFGDTCWLGDRVIIKPNGQNIFFNNQHDSIVIETQAAINDSWQLYKFGNGDYILATVDSIKNLPVLGITDSVKYILLTAKNSSGSTINHIINGHHLRISKNFGFVTTIHLFKFPSENYEYDIIGMSNPPAGLQNLSASEIFNLDIGDTLQFSDYFDWSIPDYRQDYFEKRVIGKTTSNNLDTITYTYDHKFYTYYTNYPWDTSYFYNDTITETVVLSDYERLNEFPKKVHQVSTYVFGFGESIVDSSLYNNRRIKYLEDYYELAQFDSCFVPPLGHCIFPTDGYAEGLGYVSTYDWDGGFGPCRDMHLVYYRKGNETWGTPLNWPVILSSKEISKSPIEIFPNPFSTEIHLKNLPQSNVVIILQDESGRNIFTSSFSGEITRTISTVDLSPGIYFLSLSYNSRTFHFKLVRQ